MNDRVRIVGEEITRLSTMLDEFLGLARPRLGDLRPVDVARVVGDVIALEAPRADEANVTLASELDADAPRVRADEAKVKQALLNLVVNAIDAMRERGRGGVVIRARAAGEGWVELCVDDDGPGDRRRARRARLSAVRHHQAGRHRARARDLRQALRHAARRRHPHRAVGARRDERLPDAPGRLIPPRPGSARIELPSRGAGRSPLAGLLRAPSGAY